MMFLILFLQCDFVNHMNLAQKERPEGRIRDSYYHTPVPSTYISKYQCFLIHNWSTEKIRKTISSSKHFSIPWFAGLCRYNTTCRRSGMTYLPRENARGEIVFVGFLSHFSCVLAEKKVWVNDVIGQKCIMLALHVMLTAKRVLGHMTCQSTVLARFQAISESPTILLPIPSCSEKLHWLHSLAC
jgi:hypothetical protein